MSEKMSPCCGRLAGKVTATRGALAAVANKAAYAESKGRPMERWKRLIVEAKEAVKQAEETLANHEAEHAGVPA